MDLDERFSKRVDERAVAEVLYSIAATPNRRATPTVDDLAGSYDFWFDGGAAKIQTGYVEYFFATGTHATVGVPIPALSVTIEFPSGCRVRVQQESWGFEAPHHRTTIR